MAVIAHTMEYRGGPQQGRLPVRPYTDSDYKDYQALYNTCFRPMRQALGRYPLDCCPSPQELAGEAIFLYRCQGRLVGAFTLRGREIDGLIVAPEHQGQGIGRKLLATALGQMQQRLGPARLHVADWNQRAITLYRSMGFVIVHTEGVP